MTSEQNVRFLFITRFCRTHLFGRVVIAMEIIIASVDIFVQPPYNTRFRLSSESWRSRATPTGDMVHYVIPIFYYYYYYFFLHIK